MIIEPEITAASIVLIGNFNPAIFSPDWFVRHGLIRESEVLRDSDKLIILPQIAQFSLEWCQIGVDLERFSITTSNDPLIRISDLMVRVFGEFLPHTPLRQLGINRDVHFRVRDIKVRDAIGWKLAPPAAWGDWSSDILAQKEALHGGMLLLTMQQRVFADDRTGYINATVRPSPAITEGSGIHVQVNDHYEANPANDGHDLIQIIREKAEESWRKSEWIVDQIMKLANSQTQL